MLISKFKAFINKLGEELVNNLNSYIWSIFIVVTHVLKDFQMLGIIRFYLKVISYFLFFLLIAGCCLIFLKMLAIAR